MLRLWRYVFGPEIQRIHRSNDGRNRAYNYYHNDIELLAQRVITAAHFLKNALYYTSPLVVYIVYKRGCCMWAVLLNSMRLAGWSAMIVGGALLVRGFGRTGNKEYGEFLTILGNCIDNPNNRESKAQLRRYDFDFSFWPVDYVAAAKNEKKDKKQRWDSIFWKRLSLYANTQDLILYGLPKETFAFVVGNTVGLWMMFPGSVQLFNLTCGTSMRLHRNRLIEERCGFRAKVETVDGNFIDTVFFDRRAVRNKGCGGFDDPNSFKTRNATTLVICSEGNAGFYECGILGTPLECGYSVLGWNHPGFMSSTGKPYPQSDVYALDVVVEYAVKALGFAPSNIILYGWSIGAFSVICVASQYPALRGIVIDATFYDALIFSKQLFPSCLDKLVTLTMRTYLDMNNACNLRSYHGPIMFIRREKDEVMNIGGVENVHTNLANRLFEDFLRTRFPNLFEKRSCGVDERDCPQALLLRSWLAVCNEDCRDSLLNKWDVHSGESRDILVQALRNGVERYPMQVGIGLTSLQKSRCVLFLAHKYMQHFNSSHCSPLPPCLFVPPFKLEDLVVAATSVRRICSDDEITAQNKIVTDIGNNFLPF